MKSIEVLNPFNAPTYYLDVVSSTMDVSRKLSSNGEPHGTVITADFQEAGRGRIQGRFWQTERKKNLMFTILFRYNQIEDIPKALTLRTGLAVSLAIEDFLPCLKNKVKVKWPNDIIIENKKAAGILCEADGGYVHIGIGVNVLQKEFPSKLKNKATSLCLTAIKEIKEGEIFILLEKILKRLYEKIENDKNDWKLLIEKRLYKMNERVVFIEGAADSGMEIKGTISGIGDNGELLIIPENETQTMSFYNGELMIGLT
ncbi:MAG: biotin--[acetyl-CoA-carboxylase] ligase [Treponema sp.]|nr:biotin--[acetyl-CoA-carboxylase] ligase [Treponema sp.]